MKVLAVGQDLVTAWGCGEEACWQGLLTGKPAFSNVDRFDTRAFSAHLGALVKGLDARSPDSLVMQLLRPILAPLAGRLPEGTWVMLASTTGEVDLLERRLLGEPIAAEESRLDRLLGRIQNLLGVSRPGQIVSAACASSSAAVARGAALVAAGKCDSVLVVACDALTEFVYAGFSALMALDPEGARPFDRDRKGLTIGDAAAYVLLMSEERARRESRPVSGEVAGWGLSCDANHMTGPSRDGAGLTRAIRQALGRAGVEPGDIGSISTHGTGTVYNDSMELKAFNQVFESGPVPAYSVKGSVGHTMGAAGLVEMIIALRSLHEDLVPPSAHLAQVDPEAEGWVASVARHGMGKRVALSTNSGFGGVNAALVLRV
jgi:3-oxoacyl-[acyl-carrier-protein] synthase II